MATGAGSWGLQKLLLGLEVSRDHSAVNYSRGLCTENLLIEQL